MKVNGENEQKSVECDMDRRGAEVTLIQPLFFPKAVGGRERKCAVLLCVTQQQPLVNKNTP